MPTTTMPGATTTSTTDALWRVTLVTLHSILWLRDAVSWSVSWLWLGLSYALKHKGVKLDCISTDVKALKKVPHHLALVVQERCVSCEDLARAMTWAFASDIRLVSIYDPYGTNMWDISSYSHSCLGLQMMQYCITSSQNNTIISIHFLH